MGARRRRLGRRLGRRGSRGLRGGGQEDAASVAAIRHAVARGVNWIDTAAVYGLGRSERVVGMALRDIPRSERPYVFTKCGLVWDEANPKVTPQQIANPS